MIKWWKKEQALRMEDVASWYGDEDSAVLVNTYTGRMYGRFQHDGYGKWDIWVYVSCWQAWKVIRQTTAGFWSLGSFPRCTVSAFRAKTPQTAAAAIEELSGARLLTPDDLADHYDCGDED